MIADVPRCLLSETQWRSIGEGLDLAPRELQVVRGIFNSLKEVAIARELGISPDTVHTHVKRIYRKLGAHDHVAVVVRVFHEYVARQEKAGDEKKLSP